MAALFTRSFRPLCGFLSRQALPLFRAPAALLRKPQTMRFASATPSGPKIPHLIGWHMFLRQFKQTPEYANAPKGQRVTLASYHWKRLPTVEKQRFNMLAQEENERARQKAAAAAANTTQPTVSAGQPASVQGVSPSSLVSSSLPSGAGKENVTVAKQQQQPSAEQAASATVSADGGKQPAFPKLTTDEEKQMKEYVDSLMNDANYATMAELDRRAYLENHWKSHYFASNPAEEQPQQQSITTAPTTTPSATVLDANLGA